MALAEVGILIVDDDVVSQRALKNILDSEGWRVRIVPLASAAMLELASGEWSLVIVNIALTDVRGQLFSILKELAQTESYPAPQTENEAPPKRIRVLFLTDGPTSDTASEHFHAGPCARFRQRALALSLHQEASR